MSQTTIDTVGGAGAAAPSPAPSRGRDFGIRRRRAAEGRYKTYGILAICVAIAFLGLLLFSIVTKGVGAFYQTKFAIEMDLSDIEFQVSGASDFEIGMANLALNNELTRRIGLAVAAAAGVDPDDRRGTQLATAMVSDQAANALRRIIDAQRADARENGGTPEYAAGPTEFVIVADGDIDAFMEGDISRDTPNERRQVKDAQIAMLETLESQGQLLRAFNWELFTNTSSPSPEVAGMSVAIYGSAVMMLIVLGLALPIGVAASIYLEEFAPKNRFTDLIEVNISNLAAVPSIVFGILGLAIFINFAGLPRSSPVVGGLVLTLMTLPTIIIATRASLKAVPPSIREAALGVGASKMQSVFHHVLPLALPGILTGTIIGLAQALGETAPLLIIGMDAAVTNFPGGPFDAATSMPSQIYSWSRGQERAFVERTSGGIIVLLMFLLVMNVTAVLVRRRFERRW